jgi:hypothetical protein
MILDQEIQLRSLEGLVGHTIKAVIESTGGKRHVRLVIVTDTGCWLALDATNDGDYAILEVDPPGLGMADIPLGDYLSSHDAFTNGLINKPTHDILWAKEEEAVAAEKKRKADRLRKELAELEGGAA